MPFYFALPRTGYSSGQGRQSTGRIDYIRTAPTSLTFTTSVTRNRTQIYLPDYLHCVVMSALAGEKSGKFDKSFDTDCPSRMLFTQVRDADVIHITLPKLSFRFTNLTEAQVERLDELDMEDRNVKGKGKVWVGALSPRSASEVIGFGIQDNYAAMGGTISYKGIEVIGQIIRLITLSAQSLSMVNESVLSPVRPLEFMNSFETINIRSFSSATMSEDTKAVKDVRLGEQVRSVKVLCKAPLPKITGTIADLSGIVSHGIFCPFEPNFSQTDKRAIHLLLSDFSCLASEPENFDVFDEDFVEFWTKEICLTMEGEFIAHMIASLSLAKRIGSKICFLVTGAVYEGSILHGAKEFSFKLVGGQTYKSLDKAALLEDVEGYAFHSTTLHQLLEEVGIGEDVNPRRIKSMRQLRSIIMGKRGHALPPDIEATVSKKLLFLNFREKPESVNPSSIGKFVSYIHPTAPTLIPETTYMDRRAFFSKDPICLALSMFGMYAPSPIISGQTLLLAVPSGSNKKPSNEPPSIQFCLKELSVSSKDWEGFLRGGSIIQPPQKIRRGRRFAGNDKSEIWGRLTSLAAAGISAKRNEAGAQKTDREAEKRSREEDQDPGLSDRKQRLKKVVDLSVFESMVVRDDDDAMDA